MDVLTFFFILICITCVLTIIATIGSIIRYRKTKDEDELRSAYYGIACFAIGVAIAVIIFLNRMMEMK